MTTGSTPKRERFAQEIVRGASQSEAYRIAFKADRMKPDTIHKRASELMRDGWVKGRVAELAAGVERELTIEVADLLREAGRIVFSDIRKITKPNGTLMLPHELDADTAAVIKSFEIDKDGAIKYVFWDKNSAIERPFKHKCLFELDNKQKADPLAELLGALKGNVVGPVPQEGKG